MSLYKKNYRPVSTLPVSTLPIFGKIFEKVIYDRLYNYFVSQGALYDRQFGFRKKHSANKHLGMVVIGLKQIL